MSLTGRFSALFLAALAAVLVGFSAAMYASAHVYLHHQVRERAGAALAVLAVAAEVHPGGVEWEPEERVLLVGQGPSAEALRWAVFDDRQRRVDQSRNWNAAGPAADLPPHGGRVRAWYVALRRVSPGDAPVDRDEPAAGQSFHPYVTLAAYAPLAPTEATLAALGWLLIGLDVGTWLLALLICRRLSRRALAPLSRLVASANGLDASDAGWQLDEPGTKDELAELGGAFNRLLARLHAAYEQQRRFSADASHQLRTPLTVLIGQLEVALRRERSGEEYRRALAAALGRAVQLGQIVEALLFLARAEGDAALPAGAPLDLNRWAADHIAAVRDAPIELRPAPGGPLWVTAHEPLLAQLLDNLLDNARKYGTAQAPVIVATARDGDAAILLVEDSGPGIAAEQVPRVFEPFYRAPEARRSGTPGVGLGLAVVERIARAFGGAVQIHSHPGQGCRVEVRLPAAIDGGTDPSALQSAAPTTSSTPAAGVV